MHERQHHRKSVRHYPDAGHLHELTFSCYRRLPLLTNDDWRRRLAHSIDSAAELENVVLHAFVFMPEHVHLIIGVQAATNSISRFVARLKQPFSKSIKQTLRQNESALLSQLTVEERPGKQCFRFWQEGPGYDRNLYSPQAIAASLDYIHLNPVTRHLCRRAIDWKWSSARFYLDKGASDSDLPKLWPFPHGSLD
jgi:putative transposase